MAIQISRNDLPVLLLYNIDPSWSEEEIREANQAADILCAGLQDEGHPVTPVCLQDTDLAGCMAGYDPNEYLVFNWCEEIPGIPRSFWLIARTLEQLGFVFTGSDSQALAFSQDKRLVKRKLKRCGIPTPAWRIYTDNSHNGWQHFPAIVKPAFEHSSFGLTREAVVRSPQELHERIGYVLECFSQPALVEEFVDGREFHVTVIGNGSLHTLPPAEMDFSVFQDVRDRMCTFESKFDPQSVSYNSIQMRLPAELTAAEQSGLEQVAVAAYQATDCRDYARLDIRLQDGIFYVLDVNPNADISPDTSLALAAELVGLPYGKLGSYLVNLAARRHPLYGIQLEEVQPVLDSCEC